MARCVDGATYGKPVIAPQRQRGLEDRRAAEARAAASEGREEREGEELHVVQGGRALV